MAQLEQQLGELTGILKGLVPAIERLEQRQNETERNVSSVETRVEGLREVLVEANNRNDGRVRDLYGKCETAIRDHKDNCAKIQVLERDVADLKKKEEGWGQKTWDVIKILIAAAVSAYITWRLTKG